ncbi:hypothetical protein D3C81_1795750 [compost metagenome]
MGGDDQQTLLAKIRIAQGVQRRLWGQAAKASTQGQGPGSQRRTLPGQIEKTLSRNTALQILTVVTDPYLGIKKAPQPVTLDPHLQNQGLRHAKVTRHLQDTIGQGCGELRCTRREVIAIIVVRCVEQMVSEPGFMGDPTQQQEQRQRPPRDKNAKG